MDKKEENISLSNEQAFKIINEGLLIYNNFLAVGKVEYDCYKSDRGGDHLFIIMSYSNGNWDFNLPGFSGVGYDIYSKYNFQNIN